MSRYIVIHAECTPPANLTAIGATPERMSKTVPEQGAAEAAREFAESCVRTGIFACHGTVTMTFTVCTNNGHCQYLADAKSMCSGCRARLASSQETRESPEAQQQRNSEWDRQREQIAASTWRCTVCNNVNPDDATHCRQCEYSRMVTRDGRLVPRDGQR